MKIFPDIRGITVKELVAGADAAVWHSHMTAARKAKNFVREEDFVATMVTTGVIKLAEQWGRMLSEYFVRVRISGVFCHGHPQVRFLDNGNARTVEFGDLLIVRQHRTKRNRIYGRAFVIQAKTSAKPARKLSAGDAQLALYTKWPDFEFISGGLSRGTRNVGRNERGSSYALVHDKPTFPENLAWPG